MTKRPNTRDEKNNNKKSKFDDDIDALWGDELDESVLDDCIKLTQAFEDHKKENESILPSYNVFKVPKPMFCSTQLDTGIPTTSKNSIFYEKSHKSESEIQKLRSQCEEKDGEIAILRSQLKEIKTQTNSDFLKAQSEWKTKLNLSEKQIQCVRSELEFKNLEIGNLKQKVLSVTKHSMNMTIYSDINMSPKPSTNQKQVEQQNNTSKKLFVLLNTEYPLKGLIDDSVFATPKNEKFIIENKLPHSFKNAIPYLQNKTISTQIIIDKNRADLQSVFPIMLKLCECTPEEINSISNIHKINKIVCTGLQCLEDLLEFLQEIKKNLRTEDLLEADSLYLKSAKTLPNTICESNNELGVKSAFILQCLSDLLPYNHYLKSYIIDNKNLDLREELNLIETIPYLNTNRKTHDGQAFLNKLVNILKLVGEIRKSNVMSSFLKSTIKLFTCICKLNGYTNLSDIICTVTKELIFLRPNYNITFELTYLLREESQYTSFVQFLLNKSKNCCFVKKGVLYFNEDACRFYVFVLIFDRCLGKNKTVPLEICLNMLFFIYNTYKSSYSLHHQDTKECECLPQLYKLEIELIFRMMDKYTEEITFGRRDSNWDKFFNNRIVLKVLNLMAFHCYELTEKYINVYSQFKEIERRFNENGVCDLDRLNINEDIPEIDGNSFENIGF